MAARMAPVKSHNVVIPDGPHGPIHATIDVPAEHSGPWSIVAHCFTCDRKAIGVTRISKTLARRGFASIRINFCDLTLTHNVEDLLRAAQWLGEEFGASPQLIVGHSLGGIAAIRATAELDSVRAVATVGTPFDPRHAIASVAPMVARLIQSEKEDAQLKVTLAGREVTISRSMVEDLERSDTPADLVALTSADVKLLVIHSPSDATVPFSDARLFLDANSSPTSLIALPEIDHLMMNRGSGQRVGELIAQWALPYSGVE